MALQKFPGQFLQKPYNYHRAPALGLSQTRTLIPLRAPSNALNALMILGLLQIHFALALQNHQVSAEKTPKGAPSLHAIWTRSVKFTGQDFLTWCCWELKLLSIHFQWS
jgi:hypothetical protein